MKNNNKPASISSALDKLSKALLQYGVATHQIVLAQKKGLDAGISAAEAMQRIVDATPPLNSNTKGGRHGN